MNMTTTTAALNKKLSTCLQQLRSSEPSPVVDCLTYLHELISENTLTLDILEQQVSSKANSAQLQYALAQKLSVGEFLGYFEKIERVLGGVGELPGRLAVVEGRLTATEDRLELCCREARAREEQEGKFRKQMRDMYSRVAQQQPKIPDFKQVITDLSLIAQDCQTNKLLISQLCTSLAKNDNTRTTQADMKQYVRFTELRAILAELESSLSHSVTTYIADLQQSIPPVPTTIDSFSAVWLAHPQTHSRPTKLVTFTRVDSLTAHYSLRQHALTINQQGYYQVICGFAPRHPVQVTLLANGAPVAHHTCLQPTQGTVCRAIMLYLQVGSPCEIGVQCVSVQGEEGVVGYGGRGATGGFVGVRRVG